MRITEGKNTTGEYLDIEVIEGDFLISYIVQQIWNGWVCVRYNYKNESFTFLESFIGREIDKTFYAARDFIFNKIGENSMKWEQCDWVGDGIDACHQQQLNWADGEIDDHQQTQAKILLLSIKPEFSSLILDRKKTVELRRVRPKQAETGSLAVVYVTAPVQAIVFAFLIKKIVEEPIDSLWEVVKDKAGITRYEFDDYYQGAETGVGIFIDGITGLIQQKWEKPPQSFAYITEDQLTSANGARCRLLKKKGRELSPKSYP